MRTRLLLAILAVGIDMPLSAMPPAQVRRISPAEIYPDPLRTPGAANPEVTWRNNHRHGRCVCVRPLPGVCYSPVKKCPNQSHRRTPWAIQPAAF
jgi:hypothetical protein